MTQWLGGGNRKQRLVLAVAGVAILLLLVTYVGAGMGKKTEVPLVATPTAQSGQQFLARDYQDLSRQSDASSAALAPGWSLGLGVIGKLLIVLLLLYATVWALRRYVLKGRARIGDGTAIKVLESTALAQRQRLYLVRAGERLLLLGGTDHQINTLAEFPDASAVLSQLDAPREKPEPPSFHDLLQRIKPLRTPREPAPAAPAPEMRQDERVQALIGAATTSLREKVARLRQLP